MTYSGTTLMKKILAITALISSSVAQGATLFSQSPTSFVTPTQTFANVNDSFTYTIGVVGDTDVTPWSLAGEDNNLLNVTGAQARITLIAKTGSGSLVLGSSSATNSFDITSSGTVGSFAFRIEYLNSAGGALGMTGREANAPNFGPMAHILLTTAPEAQTVALSLLDSGNNVIDPGGYTSIADDSNGYAANNDPSPDYNAGVLSFDLANLNDIGNIHRFSDATPTDGTDDLFSGSEISITAADGAFADGAAWRFSVDSSIQAVNGVPEPSAFALLSFATGLLCFKRRRKI